MSKKYLEIFIKLAIIVLSLVFLISSAILTNKTMLESKTIIISEVCPINFANLSITEDVFPGGWIELYNASDYIIDLADYSISIDDKSPIRLHPYRLIPGDVRLISFDEDIEYDENYCSDLIKQDLSIAGSVALVHNHVTVDYLRWFETPVDTSLCRITEDSGSTTPTVSLCSSNPGIYVEYPNIVTQPITESPIFSTPSGIYNKPFKLILSAPNADYDIYYTTDGSMPNLGSNRYDGPIDLETAKNIDYLSQRTDITDCDSPTSTELDTLRVIRAILVDSNGNSSDVSTAVYGFESELRFTYSKYPILSLVIDPYDLLDSDYGIMVLGSQWEEYIEKLTEGMSEEERAETINNIPSDSEVKRNYDYRGRIWERRTDLQYLVNGSSVCDITCGVRNKARTSAAGYQKAFNIYAREFYNSGQKYLPTALTGLDYLAKSVSLKKLLRGNPFPEKSIDELVVDRVNIGTQKCTPVQLFINGIWWGSYELIEKCDDTYFKAHYNIANNNLEIIKGYEVSNGNEKAWSDYTQLLEWVQNTDFSELENWESLKDQVDISNIIDFYIIHTYIADRDYDEFWNNIIWRSKNSDFKSPYADGKWRYTLYDLDRSRENYKDDFLSNSPMIWHDAAKDQPLLNAILQNEEGRLLFYDRYKELASSNFSTEYVTKYIMGLYDEYYDFIVSGYSWKDENTSTESANEWIDKDLSFWKNRYPYAIKYLEDIY